MTIQTKHLTKRLSIGKPGQERRQRKLDMKERSVKIAVAMQALLAVQALLMVMQSVVHEAGKWHTQEHRHRGKRFAPEHEAPAPSSGAQ